MSFALKLLGIGSVIIKGLCPCCRLVHTFCLYLTILPQVRRVGYEMTIYHLIFNEREWNNCFY